MKILIVNNNMQVGGIQKALANLLSNLPEHHNVTLMLFNGTGELMDCVDERVNIITGNFFTRVLGMSQAEAAEKGKITGLYRGVCALLTRIVGAGKVYGVLSKLQKITSEYDVAISYMQNSDEKTFYGGCNEFVLNSVKAKKKIAFIHCDFQNYPGNNPYNISVYNKFDKIACVSESVKKVFDKACPLCSTKTVTTYNMYDFDYMKKSAEEYEIESDDGRTVLFTSARISEEKGILRMMPILSKIKQNGGNFVWYIAGYGPDYELAVEACKKSGLENDVVFLGLTKNPYPYFKNADLVLVPSYNEAAPMVYMEAMFFGTPVFTTNTTSARELISESWGCVVNNNDKEIEIKLGELLINTDNIKKLVPKPEVDNIKAVGQFEKLLAD